MSYSGVTTITVIAAAITASMYVGDMAPVVADPTAEQGASGVGFGYDKCGVGLHLVVVTATDETVCVTAEEGKMMESEGEGFFYDVPMLAKAIRFRDSAPFLEEIRYWSWYDVKFPPFTQLFDIDEAKSQAIVDDSPPSEIVWDPTLQPDWLDGTIPTLTNTDWGLDPNDEEFWPQYVMEFPYTSFTSRSFEVPYNYTYVIPGEGGDYENPIHQCPRERCEGQYLEIQTTSHARLLNEGAELILQATDSINSPERHYNVYRMDLPFDNTKPMQLDLEFFVTWPFDQEHGTYKGFGTIYPRVHDTGDIMYYAINGYIGYIIYDPTLGDGMADQAWFTVPEENFAAFKKDYDPRFDKTRSEIWVQGLLDRVHERVPIPPEIIPKSVLGPVDLIDGTASEYYLYLVGNLVEGYLLGDYQRILQGSNVKQEWIDMFLYVAPYLKPTLLKAVLEACEDTLLYWTNIEHVG